MARQVQRPGTGVDAADPPGGPWDHSDALGRVVIAIYRFGHRVVRNPGPPLVRHLLWAVYRLLDLLLVRIAAGCYIPARCTIGPGLRLPHANGIIIHGAAAIGDGAVLFQQVTIGLRDRQGAVPTLGDGVVVGAGAKILGPVTVGAGARIGANAVVLRDVPAGRTAVGIPARLAARRAVAGGARWGAPPPGSGA